MLNKILFLCLFAALCSTGSSFHCKGMRHFFRRLSERSMGLIDSLATNSIDNRDTNKDDTVPFPHDLYRQASNGSAEDKLDFVVKVLEEVDVLFEEDHRAASWDKVTVEHFRMAITRQAEDLGKCIHNHRQRKVNKNLRVYFKKLSSHILDRKSHSAEAWELIRKQIKTHLDLLDLLLSPLLSANN